MYVQIYFSEKAVSFFLAFTITIYLETRQKQIFYLHSTIAEKVNLFFQVRLIV